MLGEGECGTWQETLVHSGMAGTAVVPNRIVTSST